MSSNHGGPRKRPSKSLRNQAKQEESVDDSAWIHRDKLAAIEIQEMEEAGMHVRQPHRSDSIGQNGRTTRSSSRSMSRNGVRRTQSKDLLGEGGDDVIPNGHEEYEKKRVSTIHAADEEEYYDQAFDPRFHSELRTAEEVAAEHHGYRQHTVRPSTSRIPISKISPVPVPNEVVERDSPLPRSRSGSNAIPSTWEDLKRMRSGSVGSGILLDEENPYASRPQSAHLRSSPERMNNPAKGKTLGPAASQRGPRSTSAQRPTSSSGTPKRPSTSQNRPEGEAPWIATMYKPDPRLPPDQQMLPTHAKRIAQEQMGREGRTEEPYNHNSNSIKNEERSPVPQRIHTPPVVQHPIIHNKENVPPPTIQHKAAEEWPLAAAAERRSDTGSPQPGSINGGYRITPTLTATPPPPPSQQQQRSPIHEMPAPAELPVTEKPPTRMPDYDEKDDRASKKGCCCVMM
ncbi:hypothetical protein AMS68_001577 [Peltaster fructicola]|uniref:TeaA receptor TeaR n=1 Tax=Peltaster fructicola TaxID=286661 RepID=A0A6H0XNJ6_9PEZI|nr:hypothetical protein AMS68_001577 [Peltaster fructicola]